MAAPSPSNVTISLLPVSLSLVRIPRSRLPHLSHPVLRQILQPKPIFLNVTCNEIELSLFAEHYILSDFELIARRDRQKLRSRSGSGPARTKRPESDDDDRVEFSCEKWKVLQLDSHSDQLGMIQFPEAQHQLNKSTRTDNSGARVHELSAPLAAAGISILYQSSYMSDFIFVKESRLREVMSLFGAAGFDLYSSDPEPLMSRVVSPLLLPVLPDGFSDIFTEFSPDPGAILTRTRSSIDTSVVAAASALQRVHRDAGAENGAGQTSSHRPLSRDKSHSPSCTDVTILPSKLACVGLADECVDSWSLKVVKLVAFPDLIPLKGSDPLHRSGYNYATNASRDKKSDEITIPSFLSWTRRGSNSTDSSSSTSEHDEGYLSHSPRSDPPLILPTTGSRSYPDITRAIPSVAPSFKPTSKHLVSQVTTHCPAELNPLPLGRNATYSPADKRPNINIACPRVPFFNFTRTSEGSSLTTDVSVLAALFPPGERHMLICAGELDALNANSDSDSDQEQNGDALSESGTLKCLQIDLRRFGLDKHGLVSRYSRVLEENRINHMYSSTFKTANLLVTKVHACRARDLLKAC